MLAVLCGFSKYRLSLQTTLKIKMSTYSLDAEKFISEIKKHKQLWDVDADGKPYRSGVKEKAWCAVARVFIQDFDSLTSLEQAEVYRKLYNKWRNIRDAYVRNIRSTRVNKSGKYVFMKQLSFLNSRYKSKDTSRSDDQSNDQSSDDDNFKNDISCESDEPSIIENLKRRRVSNKKKKINIMNTHATEQNDQDEKPKKWQTIEIVDPAMTPMHYSEFENPIAMSRVNDEISTDAISATTFDEDRSFFDSLLPAVREFDMDQKLKFRFEVLRVIKDIRSSNQASCKPEPSSGFYIE
ncbi:uncharacterized protein [Maniola hyperantus]|uniref:uncharacterized protein isoform X2 n=1 Tax=Aphantopus hyperantus TaxID=2795564 RepID=UPI0037492059